MINICNELLNKNYYISNTDLVISRGDYESFPCAMMAWNWTEKQMSDLAEMIGHNLSFDKKMEDMSETELDEFDDEFYRVIENSALDMGMKYYEDLSEEEYKEQKNKWEKLESMEVSEIPTSFDDILKSL